MARKPAEDVKREINKEIWDDKHHVQMMTPERIAEAYRNLFAGVEGQIVLADLRARFHLGVTIKKRANGIDPYETHFNEGQRSIYVALCEKLQPPASLASSEPHMEDQI